MTMTGERSSTDETHDQTYDQDEGRYQIAAVAMGVGVVFGLIGALGFVPGVTQHVAFKAGERFSGPESHAMLFGVFQTSVMANLIFLGFGILAAVSAFFELTSRLYLFFAFVVFAFFGIYGLSIDRSSAANFLPMNGADNWLHLGIAVVLLALGVVFSLRRRS